MLYRYFQLHVHRWRIFCNSLDLDLKEVTLTPWIPASFLTQQCLHWLITLKEYGFKQPGVCCIACFSSFAGKRPFPRSPSIRSTYNKECFLSAKPSGNGVLFGRWVLVTLKSQTDVPGLCSTGSVVCGTPGYAVSLMSARLLLLPICQGWMQTLDSKFKRAERGPAEADTIYWNSRFYVVLETRHLSRSLSFLMFRLQEMHQARAPSPRSKQPWPEFQDDVTHSLAPCWEGTTCPSLFLRRGFGHSGYFKVYESISILHVFLPCTASKDPYPP